MYLVHAGNIFGFKSRVVNVSTFKLYADIFSQYRDKSMFSP